MEALAALQSSPCCCGIHDLAIRSTVRAAHRPDISAFEPKSPFLTTWSRGCSLTSVLKKAQKHSISLNCERNFTVRASSSAPIAPLRLESPIGQFLSQILVNHPHLLPAAVDQQLEQLQTDREAEKSREEPSTSGTDLILYRRIAEVKANERRRTLEEILYALVVQKFVEANISLVPAICQSIDTSGRVDNWPPSKEDKLECQHSPAVYEMIKTYLTQILGQGLDEPNIVVAISKLQVGRVYAASVMFGYFLKQVDQRFQLEKSMKTLPWGTDDVNSFNQAMPNGSRPSVQPGNSSGWASATFGSNGYAFGSKPSQLWTYVMAFDPETTRRYATIRSKEAFTIIDKQTEALFGKSEILATLPGSINSSNDELINISFGGLRRLILEAVTFGSFLWDVESYVDSRYHLVNS